MPDKAWHEITYLFQNLGMDKESLRTLHNGCNYLFIPGLELIHVSKTSPCYNFLTLIYEAICR